MITQLRSTFTRTKLRVRATLALSIAVLTRTLDAGGASAAAVVPKGNSVCKATLLIYTTSFGNVVQTGQIFHATDSGVGGVYNGGFLNEYAVAGAQDNTLNGYTGQGGLTGWFKASGVDATLTIGYVGQADLNTGVATD